MSETVRQVDNPREVAARVSEMLLGERIRLLDAFEFVEDVIAEVEEGAQT